MNTVTMLGRLVNDPAKREANGSVVCEFRLASGKANTKSGQVFMDVETWGQLAGRCAQHLRKGRRVYVSGSLHQKQYHDREGQRREATFVRANEVEFVDKPANPAQTNGHLAKQ